MSDDPSRPPHLIELEREAREHIAELKGFYSHLGAYFAIMALLHLINLVAGGGYWAVWPALIWGLFLLLHGNSVFGWFTYFSKEWEERKVQEYIERKGR